MPKTPPHDASGYYHVIIPLDALQGGDESAVDIQPITEGTANELIRLFETIGRNQCCPCGSGVKFKKCCLRRAN
jgi:SEC-C motif